MKNEHGANLFDISERYGFDIDEIVDFSSNINPLGPPSSAIDVLKNNPNIISMYPDPNYTDLKKAISDYTCFKTVENILLSSGASGFIKTIISTFRPKRACIYAPTYSEYEKELIKVDSKIFKYNLNKDEDFKIDVDDLISFLNSNEIDLLMIANPNNPTGTMVDINGMEKLLKNVKCFVVIDETYIEFSEQSKYSSAKLVNSYKNLIVIRSTSKFFACPGIRLGYALTSNDFFILAFKNKGTLIWDINIFAQLIGEKIFLDRSYHEMVYEYIESERKYFYDKLKDINGLTSYPSKANFILVEIKNKELNAKKLYDYLIKRKFIIRNCFNFENLGEKFFRICIMDRKSNRELISYIQNFFGVKN